MNTEEIKKYIKDKTNGTFTIISGNYINNMSVMAIRHNTCKYEFNQSTKNILNSYRKNKGGCPKCAAESRKKNLTQPVSFKEFKAKFAECNNENEYILMSKTYTDNKTKITVKHKECGNIYDVRPNDFQQGYRCPKCAKTKIGLSKNELDLSKILKDAFKDEKIILNDKKIINPFELDIYFPDKKIAIEYDGLYWHSEERNGRPDNLLNKTNLCKEKGIRLIHVFEDEYISKKDLVVSKILHILGHNDGDVIYARKCNVVELNDVKLKNSFLNENHMQGADRSVLNLGLMYENELVGIMTLANLRISLGQHTKDGTYELSRFATVTNRRIIGGFGKLWKYFIRNYDFDSIITYADYRWSEGSVYLTNGFKLSHISKPNYWYSTKSGSYERFHRYNFRKQLLKEKFPEIYSDDKTEKQIMQEAKYIRIYDCGNLVFRYENE